MVTQIALVILSILLIIISITIIYTSLEIREPGLPENISDELGTFDGVGSQIWAKRSFPYLSSPVVSLVALSTFASAVIVGMRIGALKTLLKNKIDLRELTTSVTLLVVLFGLTVSLSGFPNWIVSYQSFNILLFVPLFIVPAAVLSKVWELWKKDKLIVFLFLLLTGYGGLGLVIELGNYLILGHGRDWAVDMNMIVIHSGGPGESFVHSWTLGYTAFRIGNYLMIFLSIVFFLSARAFRSEGENN